MIGHVLSAKVGVAALVAVLAGGTAAAAATGSLPDPAQRVVAGALAHVDVSVPAPNDHANAHAFAHAKGTTDDTSTTTGADTNTPDTGKAKGPDATGPAKFGLCTAWSAGPSTTNPKSGKAASVAFSNLQQAATDAGMSVADFCKDATHPDGADTTTTGADQSDAETPGSGTHGPPVSTPNSGGNGHGSTAAVAGSANADNHPAGRP